MQHHKRTPMVYEIIERAAKLDDQAQINFLRQNAHPAVQQVLQLAFNGFEYLVPTETPPLFTPANEESAPSNLHRQFRNLAMVVKGAGHDQMNAFRRENAYVQLLESIPPQEAMIVISLVMGEFTKKYPTITQANAAAAFPKAVKAPSGKQAETVVKAEEQPDPAVGGLDGTIDDIDGITSGTFTFNPADAGEYVLNSVDAAEAYMFHSASDNTMHFRGSVKLNWDFTKMDDDSFGDLKRAIMRENHARTQAKKKADS